MVDGSLFDSLEAIARSLRGNNKPFGGIQLILAGFYHKYSCNLLYLRSALQMQMLLRLCIVPH